jgi:thiosulfate/3-mercaptopyruvate sulfurtransferase
MMPSEQTFAEACSSLGIVANSHVVLYDTHGVFSSPRALFMFKAFGHENASVLDGGLPRWVSEGLTTEETAPAQISSTNYPTPKLDQSVVRDYKQMLSNACLSPDGDDAASLVLDARPKGRFLGTDPEPRPGLSSGHMPNSVSLPFSAFLETKHAPNSTTYTVLKSSDGIRAALIDTLGSATAEEVFAGRKSVTTSCGSGMTAGVLWLGLKLAIHRS